MRAIAPTTRPGTAVPLVCFLLAACASGGGDPAPRGAAAELAAPEPADSAPSVPAPDRETLCEGIFNYYDCSRTVEQVQLRRLPERLERSGDTLWIELAAGRRISVVDRDVGGPGDRLFTYSDYLADIGYHLLNVHYYEGTARLLIDDRTGQRTRVSARPVVSPRARRIVVASEAGIAGYSPNELQVWRVAPDGLELEWELRPEDWGATDARWEDPETVRFTRTRVCRGGEICGRQATLRRTADGWTVEAGPRR